LVRKDLCSASDTEEAETLRYLSVVPYASPSRMIAPKVISFDLDETLLDGSPWQEVISRTCDQVAPRLRLHPQRLAESNAAVFKTYFPLVEGQWALAYSLVAKTASAWRSQLPGCT
jgi:hypothetical protein